MLTETLARFALGGSFAQIGRHLLWPVLGLDPTRYVSLVFAIFEPEANP